MGLPKRAVAGLVAIATLLASTVPTYSQTAVSVPSAGLRAGQLDVPINKSQVLTADRPFAKALIGNSEIADVLPLTNRSLYVLGKKIGTTSLTLYDARNNLISVIDVAVGPDVVTLRSTLRDLMPNENIGARISGDSVVLTGTVSSGPAVDRAKQIATTYAGDKVINLLTVGASQQVMLEVRFSEMNRTVAKNLGLNTAFTNGNGLRSFQGGIGNTAPSTALLTNQNGTPTVNLSGVLESFGVIAKGVTLGNLNIFTALDALERKGVVTTLAEPTLVALSGDSASFLAGGEFPVPVVQGNGGGGGSGSGGNAVTVEFKPFGVSLAFTPTVLDDGVINLVVAPEVSSIDPSASISINGLTIPGLQTRRAKTTLELRDGQSFAIAGLLRKDFQSTVRQFPILGSIPIIGALFRSTGFQKQETELVIIVTPRLVRPVPADQMRLPTDRVRPPSELDLFLNGRTDSAVGNNPLDPNAPAKNSYPPKPEPVVPPAGGFSGPNGYERKR
ncbi:type II and III secretion system protein family protein [Sphingomonas panacisoli]|uniref:Type II and III secretion system protein family protein n=2 Tax=Sphingomonas panacisoli TaxID=1813879 RepID=A0A5B8LNM7_9SPHN|nr:type II and III secretion system protein family protein [Sphingomonas panacisoli]